MIVPEKWSLELQCYERLFNACPEALVVVDRELVIQYSNRNYAKLFAIEGDGAGVAIGQFLPLAHIENLVHRAGEERKFKESELQLKLPQGGSGFFKTTVIPFGLDLSAGAQAGNKRDSLFLVRLEDVSERVQLEEQLLQAEKLSAMGHMATSIAHELGNPLSIIITCLEFLRHSLQESNRTLEEQIAVMEENAVRMHELLISLSDMSGLGRFQPEKEDIRRAIIPVISFVSKMAEKSGITVKTDCADVPPLRLDLKQLKQVFLNLLKNAVEAMPNGGTITVRSRYAPGDCSAERGHVIVEVEDTGNGIPSGELETIFKPFYSTKKKGMGLGLSLCRGIIEKHGGKIQAAAQEGKGCCFIIEIPTDQSV
jgi:signal transduction histidine kinase